MTKAYFNEKSVILPVRLLCNLSCHSYRKWRGSKTLHKTGGFRVIRNFLQRFMTGRSGPDHLGVMLIVLSLVFYLLYAITGFALFIYVSYALLILALYRILSRNTARRRMENDRFIRYWWPVKTKVKRMFTNMRNRKTHRFFSCPSCRNTLRVPKGKGKLQITCPKCGERFIRKT